MEMLLPKWILTVCRLAFLNEIAGWQRVKIVVRILCGIILGSYLPLLVNWLKGNPWTPCYWHVLPLPIFQENPLICFVWLMLVSVIANMYTQMFYAETSIRERWKMACIRCKIYVATLDGGKDYPDIINLNHKFFRVHAKGITVMGLESKKAELSSAAGFFIWTVKEAKYKGQIIAGYIDVFYTTTDIPAVINLEKDCLPPRNYFNLGIGVNGFFMLPFSKMVHMGIAGVSGSGKSVGARSLMVQFMLTHPDSLIIGIDFKEGVEFGFFEGKGNFIMCSDHYKTAAVLEMLYSEYKRRAAYVKKTGVENIYQLEGEDHSGVNQPILIFGDEMAELYLPLPKSTEKELLEAQRKCVDIVSKIARLARFTGIHLVMSTQRPDAKAMDTQTRSMLKTRLAYKLVQKEDSHLWLNRGSALELPAVPGRFLVVDDQGNFEQLQSLYIDKQKAESWIKELPVGSNPLCESIHELLLECSWKRMMCQDEH